MSGGRDDLVGGHDRLGEARGRDLIERRFATAGVALERDYPLREGALLVTLDGYDPARRIGYAFISDTDADVVVSDIDAEAEAELRRLGEIGRAHILVVHDGDVPTTDALERRIDAFFAALPRR